MKLRLVLLLLLAAAVAGGVMLLSAEPEPAVPVPPSGEHARGGTGENGEGTPVAAAARQPFVSASECRVCHEAVYDEWQKSYHGMAWTDPMVQALSNGFRMTECIDCHAPQPIHVTGVDKRVAPRHHARSDGVDCLSCHILADGISVAAAQDIDTSAVEGACRPVKVETISVSTSCAGCHNQHETVDELLASGVDAECQTCHMPEIERPVGESTKKGRSHVFPGAHSEEMHRRAVRLDVRIEEGNVVAEVENVGAAHKVPTDARHRSYNLWVDAWDARGNPLALDQQMTDGEFRLYYRDDFRPSTQLEHHKPRTATWPVPQGFRGRVKVRLTYALNPEELAARRLFAVHEQEVTVE